MKYEHFSAQRYKKIPQTKWTERGTEPTMSKHESVALFSLPCVRSSCVLLSTCLSKA